MATVEISLPLPVLPGDWSADKDFKSVSSLSGAVTREIEPIGPHFLAHARRKRYKRTFSEDERITAAENVKKVESEDEDDVGDEPEDPLMLQRDAKDWKNQDHYAVLGLKKFRWRASEEQIKKAHRRKVLKHHPDKRAAAGGAEDDNFFKCIQKAFEVLMDPTRRRQFDSVDEAADVEPPSKKKTQTGNFYKLWGAVFAAEARFSKIKPVPALGNEKATREDVEEFYNFWYNFDSWRTFEYLDQDVPDDNENRDQKRHVERKNANERKKRKTEDTARLRNLVQTAQDLDDRLKKFMQEARLQKNKKRLDREAAEKAAAEEAARKKEDEAKAAAEQEAAAKVEKADAKKIKEQAKTALKKNRRTVRGAVKEANYFVSGDASAAQIDGALNDVDALLAITDAEETADLSAKLNGKKEAAAIKTVFVEERKRLEGAGKVKAGEMKSIEA